MDEELLKLQETIEFLERRLDKEAKRIADLDGEIYHLRNELRNEIYHVENDLGRRIDSLSRGY